MLDFALVLFDAILGNGTILHLAFILFVIIGSLVYLRNYRNDR